MTSRSHSIMDQSGDVEFSSVQVKPLDRKSHSSCLIRGLTGPLSWQFQKLVPSQTWAVYWITHSLKLLNFPQFLDSVKEDVIEFIKECAHEAGGYGGGPGQIAHLATTYAAVNALITISTDEALESIDRVKLVKFLHRMKQPNGSFSLHDDGEIDSRATYCALSVMGCLNINDHVLLENVAEWILSCQTYEGGFGSVPNCEAHGGYTFCCVASLYLLNQVNRADIDSLLRWLTNKQLSTEGGFCGRSNKLVDSCYSFWQGGVFPLLHSLLNNADRTHHSSDDKKSDSGLDKISKSDRIQEEHCSENWLFDSTRLQEYILNDCQGKSGLLMDKPGTEPDFYHTCCSLSGLSISQHQPDGSIFNATEHEGSILGQTHPVFNIHLGSLNHCSQYFSNKKIETVVTSTNNEVRAYNLP